MTLETVARDEKKSSISFLTLERYWRDIEAVDIYTNVASKGVRAFFFKFRLKSIKLHFISAVKNCC